MGSCCSSSSSNYPDDKDDVNFKVERVTTESIHDVIRPNDFADELDSLLREASLATHDFDSHRDNMQIRAYGEKKTIIVTAGDGENILEIQRDGEDKIVCTWTSHSKKAFFIKVVLPKMLKFLINAGPHVAGAIAAGAVGADTVSGILKPLT